MKRSVSLFIIVMILCTCAFLGCASGGVSDHRTTGTKSSTSNSSSAEESSSAVMDDDFISYDLHRYALVIGNGKYEEGALANPVNDAALIAEKLAAAGFDVYRYYDLRKGGMDDAVSSFVKIVNKDSQATAVVYYAGHGVEVEGVNYLIPIDNAKIESEEDVKIYAYSLDNILSLLNAREQIIILDACRNNPYKMSGDRAAGVKGGLGALKEAKKGVTMSYLFAAQSGQTAKDGEGGNSVFTAILAEEIEKGNTPINQVFNNVASRVKAMTNGEQVPLSSTTGSSFIFQSEELAKAVLAKWSQQLKQAEADLKKLESSKSTGDEKATDLAAAQAKLALAQAEKEASEKRSEQIKADAKKAAEEAEAAKSRSADLQAKIDAMKIAAENAATQVRMNSIAGATIRDAINEIESNKAKIVDINIQVLTLYEEKRNTLSAEYSQKAKEIYDAPYQKAELRSDGKPTASALENRQMKNFILNEEYNSLLADYVKTISANMEGSNADIIEIINEEAEALSKNVYEFSSLTGGVVISINQYDGTNGGWNLQYSVDTIISGVIFLPYEILTGKNRVVSFSDKAQMAEYQEYLDNVDLFDSMFRGDVPVIVVEIQCHVVIGEGTLSYQVVPDSLVIKRIDTGKVVYEMDAQTLRSKHRYSIIQSQTGLDIRKSDNAFAMTMKGSELLGIDIVYSVGYKGPAGGWVFYDKGYYSNGWRYLEAAPSDLTQGSKDLFCWGDDAGILGTMNGIGTGKSNTAIIVSKASKDINPNAATLCNDYVYGGYDDWFLPSKDELNLMYTNLKKAGLGGFVYSGEYWSSSEGGSDYVGAMYQYFHDGTQFLVFVRDHFRCRVRPIRAF